MTTRFPLPALALLPLLALPARAQAPEPFTCRNGYFTETVDALTLARVAGKKGDKAFFHSDDEGCPGKEGCRTKAYVIPGDEVFVNQVKDGWACAWYPGKTNETVGWLKAELLDIAPQGPPPRLAEWVGTWTLYENEIRIAAAPDGKSLSISGDAVWEGGQSTAGYPIVHVGELSGTALPQGSRVELKDTEVEEDYACVARLTLLGRHLFVDDNGNCGGVNVTFDGVYKRGGK